MKQIFLSRKGITVEEVPEPLIDTGMMVVKNLYSCISPGTEVAGIRSIKKNLIKKIYEKPNVIKNVFSVFNKQGISDTKKIIKKKLGQFYEIGYSSVGIVEQVDKNIKSFSSGDFVACAGGGFASHAEKILVPEKLAVKVKNSKKIESYSSVAMGAISLQGVRRLQPNLGDRCLVIGLGFIGQITLQLLKANGVNVFGVDPSKIALEKAKKQSFLNVYESINDLLIDMPQDLKDIGFDGVIVTASSQSNKILNDSFFMCRRKAKVVIVGDVGLGFDREVAYKKEIDLLMSTSYGPGRYDKHYEISGNDYPIEYVRWTLNRNMQSYIDLIDDGRVNLDNLIDKTYEIEKSPLLYKSFEEKYRPISALIKYDSKNTKTKKIGKIKSKITNNKKPNCAIIGAGVFSNEVLIPNLLKIRDLCKLNSLCVKKPLSALNLSHQNKNIEVTTNYSQILKNKNIDTIFISTRHDLHYKIIIESIKHKKNVFVEKPMCTKPEELESLKKTFKKNPNSIIVSGFNRRFSESAKIMKEFIESQNNPVFLNYTVNADKLDKSSWVYTEEGGGRNIGEACHFYDLILYLIDQKYVDINANAMFDKKNSKFNKTDNFFVQISFSNGSIAQINYSISGAKLSYKELIEIRGLNKTLINKDFKQIKILDDSKEKILYSISKPDKGYLKQYESFFNSLKKGKSSIPVQDQIDAMDICFMVEDKI